MASASDDGTLLVEQNGRSDDFEYNVELVEYPLLVCLLGLDDHWEAEMCMPAEIEEKGQKS